MLALLALCCTSLKLIISRCSSIEDMLVKEFKKKDLRKQCKCSKALVVYHSVIEAPSLLILVVGGTKNAKVDYGISLLFEGKMLLVFSFRRGHLIGRSCLSIRLYVRLS